MTVEEVQAALEQTRGVTLDRQLVALVLSAINQSTLMRHVKKRVRWEIWDQISPLNGVAASKILDRPDARGGAVYVVYIDESLALIQMHAPSVQGFETMNDDSATRHAEQQVTQIIEGLFRQSVMAAVDERMVKADVYHAERGPMPKTAVIYTEGVEHPEGIAQAALDLTNG